MPFGKGIGRCLARRLDPGEGVRWAQIAEAAKLAHAFLGELGLVSFLKTTGGKGHHLLVPIVPKEGWDEVKALSKRVVQQLAKDLSGAQVTPYRPGLAPQPRESFSHYKGLRFVA